MAVSFIFKRQLVERKASEPLLVPSAYIHRRVIILCFISFGHGAELHISPRFHPSISALPSVKSPRTHTPISHSHENDVRTCGVEYPPLFDQFQYVLLAASREIVNVADEADFEMDIRTIIASRK